VRDAATGAWYFLNPSLGVLNEFPLKPGQDDGPIVFSPDGTMAAISLIDHGALIEPVNLAPILPSPSAGAPSASPTTSPTARPTPTASPVQPRRVNSKLHHVDSLAWSPDAKTLAIATITDATPAILQKYPPLAAQVNYDHWAPLESWALTGGCTRYRVVVTGSIAPAATTFGLQSNTACLGASPSPTPS